MKHRKLKELEKSFEEGIISKEEYEKKRKEIEEMPEEEVVEEKEEVKEVKLKSDRTLIVIALAIILVFGSIFAARYFTEEQPETIDDLHELNLKGKLKEDQGYVYNDAYSFVKFEDLWYTQLVSPQGTRLYNIQFRYGPKEVENINIEGSLNREVLNKVTEYYVTFNPTGNDFSSVALAIGDFNTHMTKIFFKQPIASCDKNETSACVGRPIITCDNTDGLTLYVKEANNSRVYFDGNCMVVEGSGFDLIKGVNRVLYDFYDIIE
tara:strand:- start:31027 stop:31821 length:795 start_codon:yes stop_codon:yes gene_type:complete